MGSRFLWARRGLAAYYGAWGGGLDDSPHGQWGALTMADRRQPIRRSWQYVEVLKDSDQGQVWLVRTDSGDIGYFKWNRGYGRSWSAPLAVNETVAAALGRKLGLPVAPIELATVTGPQGREEAGVVSLRVRSGLTLPWRQAPSVVRHHPELHMMRSERLPQVLVFDAWIANYDRYIGDNLILWRRRGQVSYDWYLVDHALGLYGAPQKWRRVGPPDSAVWQCVWRFYWLFPRELKPLHTWERMAPMVERIEALSEQDIEAALAAAPAEAWTPELRGFTRDLLINRQRQLRSIIQRWLAHEGRT